MRTSAEIIQSVFDKSPHDAELKYLYEKAVNEAREEAIRECAEVAEDVIRHNNNPYTSELTDPILNLINQIK